MAFERADVFETSSIGIETTLGTAVAATKKLTGTSILNKIMAETNTFRSRGSLFPTVGIQNKEWTEADWTADVATYTESGYAIAAMLGSPSISTPAGGSLTRDWDWNPSSFSGITPKSLTLESGGFVRAGKSAGNVVTSINFDFNRDGVSMGASSIGQLYTDGITPTPGTNEVQTITVTGTPTGGSFTLTFYGETTGAIAYNATSAAVVTALEALPNIGTGGVTATGGALPGTPVVVTFKLQWASQNIGLMTATGSFTGGTSPAVAVTETTPGAPLTEVALKPISGNHWNLYVDSSAAALGTTKLTRALSTSWSLSDFWGPLWVGNTANTSWVNVVAQAPSSEFNMVVEADSTGMGYLTQFRAGTKIFPRIEAIGELIEGSLYYRLRHDLCVILTDIDPFDETDGVTTVSWTGEIVHDGTWGKALSLNQRSTLTAL